MKIDSKAYSQDGTVKYLLDLAGELHEVSYIPKETKHVFCVPSQANCKLGCKFCHLTGTTRPARNLSETEIARMVMLVHEDASSGTGYDKSLPVLVSFMGAGDPLMNVDGVVGAIKILGNAPDVRFAVSTVMPSQSRWHQFTSALSDLQSTMGLKPSVKAHLSVHGMYSRKEIVPGASLDIESAIRNLRSYDGEIEYHYTLVDGVNDSLEELGKFADAAAGIGTVKFLKLSENNGCSATKVKEEVLRGLFHRNTIEFYDPPGRDVGSSCGMFNRNIYNA